MENIRPSIIVRSFMASPNPITINLENVQALIHRQYRERFSVHLLFHLRDATNGKSLLREVLAHITFASVPVDAHPLVLVNVGITFQGMQALGVPQEVLDEFPLDYQEGPKSDTQGDFGMSAPLHWWNQKFVSNDVHLIVQVYSRDEAALTQVSDSIRAQAKQLGHSELIPTRDGQPLKGSHLGEGRVHFGYRDGISQLNIAWDDRSATPGCINFRHFLLGYSTPEVNSSPHERGKSSTAAQATALARDGSYAVFRWLYQDVAAFNRFLEREGRPLAPHLTAAQAQELLAAKIVGRWRDGTPLVLSPDQSNAAFANRDDFAYAAEDPDGIKCPFSAHIRVSNPRDQSLAPHEVHGVPRLLRRGTPYGPELGTGSIDDGIDRGLIGLFLCASIREQFFKLLQWINMNDFSPQFAPNLRSQDPFGNREFPSASSAFRIPAIDGEKTVSLVDFIRTQGTAFFLVPSFSSLRLLAA
jgi:Dyp-type peroxidase family